MVMIMINIYEAKTHLSRYLERLAKGEILIICKRNVPVAEVRPIPPARTRMRPVGLARGELRVPASFFAPLPEDLAGSFDGGGE